MRCARLRGQATLLKVHYCNACWHTACALVALAPGSQSLPTFAGGRDAGEAQCRYALFPNPFAARFKFHICFIRARIACAKHA